ncbi:MAG: TetR/AcrR family transcriptional regulator [Myxococcales bacterium]|nr:TetR/AcrR family transcriptional regulator [Myxococcales bacterium]
MEVLDERRLERPGKRARTRARILENAIALFRANGVRRAKMSEIARASGVSPATLFKHFPTKAALAEGWVRGEVEALLESLDLLAGERSLRPLLRRGARRLAERIRSDPESRLEAWREAGRATTGIADRGRRDPLVARLAREQESERVRTDLSPEALARLVRDAIEGGLIEGLEELVARRAGEDAPGDASLAENDAGVGLLERAVRVRLDLVLDGARKRNERVEAPRPPSPAGGPMAAGPTSGRAPVARARRDYAPPGPR